MTTVRAHFDRKLSELRDGILLMGSRVEEELKLAMEALATLNIDKANEVFAADRTVNRLRFEIEEQCFSLIVTQQPAARDLRTIMRRAREKGLRMPLDLSLRVVGQVCAALEYAHRKKDDRGRPMEIVHRDVSPQNILISFEGDVKLVDFGIAKAATKASNTDRGALRGKLLYMSPEQAWGRPIDRRSDVFSLGIVLYEMVTETKPFVGAGTEVSILELVRQCVITPARTS